MTGRILITHLRLSSEVRQVVLPCKVLDKGRLSGNVRRQAYGLAHISNASQQQEVTGRKGAQEFQSHRDCVYQGGAEPEPLRTRMHWLGAQGGAYSLGLTCK